MTTIDTTDQYTVNLTKDNKMTDNSETTPVRFDDIMARFGDVFPNNLSHEQGLVINEIDEYVANANAKIVNLENDLAKANLSIENYKSNIDFYRSKAFNLEDSVKQFKDMLVEAINQSEISNDLANEWAEHFGIELTRKISVEATIKVSATLVVPLDFDADDWASELSVDPDFGSLDVEWSDSEIEDSSWDEE